MSSSTPGPSSTFVSSLSSTLTSSASASATTTAQAIDNSGANTFYKNLFYILIALLGAFGLVSFVSLTRARRRRRMIVREAERLGLIVPGMEGYVPVRDRSTWSWTKSDGSDLPDWWEVGAVGWGKRFFSKGGPALGTEGADGAAFAGSGGIAGAGGVMEPQGIAGEKEDLPVQMDDTLYPLALIPPPPPPAEVELIPTSALPYFPNHLAYRPTSLAPPPARFPPDDPDALDKLGGTTLDLAVIVKMPSKVLEGEVEEGEEVLREWGGVELGLTRVDVWKER